VTLNTAVDRSYVVGGFHAGGVYRSTEYWVGAGGKGINVARVLRALGGEALVLGLAGGPSGNLVSACLDGEGIPYELVPVSGETRVCITVADPEAGVQTVINEAGPEVRAEESAAFLGSARGLYRRLEPGSLVALAGSIPRGDTAGLYPSLVCLAREQGLRSVLDASGEPLVAGAEARPWMLKCNAQEWVALEGCCPATPADAVAAARARLGGGTQWVVITLGSVGAVLVGADEAWFASPPKVVTRNAVGSGDSFLAGLLWSWERGDSPADSLAWGVAAGAANAEVWAAGGCRGERVQELRSAVTVVGLP
jgi:1-phosphofructokinase family hexose kinase